MKQALKTILISGVLVFGLAVTFLAVPEASAQNALETACQQDPGASICDQGTTGSVQTIIGTIVNTLLYIVGIIAVIMIIVAGIRYATSGGDQGAVNAAKNTILYSVIGLLVAFFAYAIVNWVLDLF